MSYKNVYIYIHGTQPTCPTVGGRFSQMAIKLAFCSAIQENSDCSATCKLSEDILHLSHSLIKERSLGLVQFSLGF